MWAQPTFETIESNLKTHWIKKQHKKAGAAPEPLAHDDGKKASPFDVASSAASTTRPHEHHTVQHLPPLNEAPDLEGRGTGALSSRNASSLTNRLSNRMSTRSNGHLVVCNSAPLPDLLPLKGEWPASVACFCLRTHAWKPAWSAIGNIESFLCEPLCWTAAGWKQRNKASNTSLTSMDHGKDSSTGAAPNLNRLSIVSVISRAGSALGSQAM